MKRMFMTAALLSVVVICPAYAQQVGQACSTLATNTPTLRSVILTEGIVQCIPDSNGHYYWQSMGAGVARYDSTATCSVAGTLRWNGSTIQYCNGSSWQSIGGGTTGKLHWDGNWTGDHYSCDSGYHVAGFHYDCNCSNNATWFECQAN